MRFRKIPTSGEPGRKWGTHLTFGVGSPNFIPVSTLELGQRLKLRETLQPDQRVK
jgi:hypothetical protein